MRGSSKAAAVVAAATCCVLAAGCGSDTTSSGHWQWQVSAQAGGGMSALIQAAKAEGHLNVIRLRSDWANYGAIMKAFTAKYGIKITDEDPQGTSASEISAVRGVHGSAAPDVLDLSSTYATYAEDRHLITDYRVQSWNDIPDTLKAASSEWYADYGGYVAIGYNPARVAAPPRTLRSLLSPAYHGQVGITGNPGAPSQAGALDAVWAASLATGGSLNDIRPGLKFFRRMRDDGNLVPVAATPATVASGRTPVLVWWDFLLTSQVKPTVPGLKIVIPRDARFENFYYQAISSRAADPAAARLWEEFLFSPEGQNLFLAGGARPSELAAMVKNGTVNQAALKALPPVPGATPAQPDYQQISDAQDVAAEHWPTSWAG